jgi:hypothetical protein
MPDQRERPIIFSAEMVRAILDGRKTQTRRVVKPQPGQHWSMPPARLSKGLLNRWGESPGPESIRCPYSPGDLLWVKHPCRVIGRSANGFRVCDEPWPAESNTRGFAWEDFPWKVPAEGKCFGRGWPKSLIRLTLRVTDVRVERVQEISMDDIVAEGLDFETGQTGEWFYEGEHAHIAGAPSSGERFAFMRLWDSINAKRGHSWESNPFVWVITFERIEQPH